MEEMMIFLGTYGWQLAVIAFVGIVLLGILKYADIFSNVEKEKRKPIYFAISVGFSVVATIVYLLVVDSFNIEYVVTVSTAIYALNQTMYAIYETTKLRDLISYIFVWLSERVKSTNKK